MSKVVKKKKSTTIPTLVQKGSRFEGLSGTRLEREVQKQIEEKRIAREQRRRAYVPSVPSIPLPPLSNKQMVKNEPGFVSPLIRKPEPEPEEEEEQQEEE